MFYSKEEVLDNFIENNVNDAYKDEISKELDVEEVVIKLTPEAVEAFDNIILNNIFSQYIVVKDNDQFPYIFHEFDAVLKENYLLRFMIHLTNDKDTKENIIHIDRKNSGRERTIYTFTQLKDNSIIIYYWFFDFSAYKDKIRNL